LPFPAGIASADMRYRGSGELPGASAAVAAQENARAIDEASRGARIWRLTIELWSRC